MAVRPFAPVQITEKLLIAAGGWEAIRHARALCEAGRVNGASYSPPLLKGHVREGDTEYSAGLKIKSQGDIENLCTCRTSRQWGTICAHSLAVGLAIVARQTPGPLAATAGASASSSSASSKPAIPFQADPGAEARLHVVLAPDLPAAWRKRQLLVGLELASGGKRAMLGLGGGANANANPKAPAPIRALLPEDFRVVEGLARIVKSVPGGMSFLGREQFLELLDSLCAHGRLTLGKAGVLRVNPDPLRPPLLARLQPDGALELSVQWPSDSEPMAAGGRAWLLLAGRELRPVSPGLPPIYGKLFEEKSMRLPADQASAFLSAEWRRLEPFFELRSDAVASSVPANVGAKAKPGASAAAPQTITTAPLDVQPAAPEFALSIEGSLHQLGARLQAVYANKRIVTIGITSERETFTFPAPDKPGRLLTRHVFAEQDALSRLKEWGFQGPDATGHYFLRGQDPILRFFARQLPVLQRDWKVTVGSRFQNVSREIEVISPEIAVRGSGEDWFDLEISVASRDGERFSAADIQRLLQTGQNSTRLRNGRTAILPSQTLDDLQEVLRDCDPSQVRPGVYRMQRAQGAYLESTFQQWNVSLAPSWQDWKSRQGSLSRPAPLALSPELEAALRPYQKEGVRWLAFLAGNRLGGILADEMGLGKTLQALAFLSAREAASKKKDAAPALVVCPTSLVENWRREALRFTPGLKVLTIDGPDRAARFEQLEGVHLAITSYALLRRDIDRYRPRTFSTVILDEAHHIKNPDSQVAQAACALRSAHRFVLTGTPMENSVRDLWSIMHFTLPGYLGARQDFRERYELPMARGGSDELRERLGRRLRPVLLRRRKREVAAELPERIEQTSFCDLTPAQAEVYRRLLEQSRQKLDDSRRQGNKGQGRMLVLTALLRLRQVCCDLRLLGLPPSDASGGKKPEEGESRGDVTPASSGKLGLLDELMEEIIEGGHRVLIFSQFVSMLKILSGHLDAAGTPYAYLDGSTKPADRAAQVDRFQKDEKITAFLISVKAGGVGLNLTGADTVIHFDPWWNPAVEAQATDRAHRIGQTRVVTAYRLIARNTVEEKIFALQQRKRELTASLVEHDDEPLMDALSFDEIESLLE
jgi:SNF2 family DNA or RNA helicase